MSAETKKIELICNGVASNYVNKTFEIKVEGSVVVIDFDSNSVDISGELGGAFSITNKTNERISFSGGSKELLFVGSVNRYTAGVILHNQWNEKSKLQYHLKLYCKVGKRLF